MPDERDYKLKAEEIRQFHAYRESHLFHRTMRVPLKALGITENLQAIIQRVNRQSDVNAVRKNEMAANDLRLFAKVFSMPLKLMVAIAFLVGSIIVGMVIYTITVERQREYGVIKAIGATNGTLYRIVLVQALAAALIGTALGVLLAYGIGEWIMRVKPQFLIILTARKLEWAFAAGLGMAVLSAFFPARVIAQVAPAEVFRK